MSVTEKLLSVYRVDEQIKGLKSRLNAAERFLGEQERAAQDLGSQSQAIDGQLRQLKAAAAEAEGEARALDEKINELRERMGVSKTNKEYQALLTEVNTFKDRKSERETQAVEMLEKIETLTSQREDLTGKLNERSEMKGVAMTDRDKRAEEIREKLAELEGQRSELASDVPDRVLQSYEQLVERLGDEAMAAMEIQDRRRHEYTCGACMMAVPMEAMSSLLSHGNITNCVSCGAILYLEEKTRERMTAGSKR
ncbi:MAG: hypothetical protein AAGI17_01610 [Planctomycetota bacterium]